MKPSLILALLATVAATRAAHAQAVITIPDPWFTGSLIAPSPALPKAGLLEVEIYEIYTADTGAYDNGGARHSLPDNLHQLQTVALFEYALTSRLSVQTVPSLTAQWTAQQHSRGARWGDLPVELDYRCWDADNHTGWPSATIALGLVLPTGAYDRLGNLLDGVGSGATLLKEGLLFQSLFETPGHHALRLRFYGNAYETIAHAHVADASVYGTTQGFHGEARPGTSASLGCAGEYCLDQHWVLVLGLAQNYTDGFTLNGAGAAGHPVQVMGANSASSAVLPAFEYNWSGRLGLIAGAKITVAGRNTPSYIAPQLALSMSF